MSQATDVAVVAVIVTWNRRELLRRCLDAVLGQTHPPVRVIVVDNASDDGTAALTQEYAARSRAAASPAAASPAAASPAAGSLPEAAPGAAPGATTLVEVVRTRTNIGGAGGFALGLSRALDARDLGDGRRTGDADAIWLLDDDTIPTPTALAQLVRARTAYALHTGRTPALVASRAVWTDGREHPMNTPRRKPGALAPERAAAARVGCVPIRTASFVSILLDLPRARQVGLPEAGFFLWNDDFDYTARVLRGQRGLFCPASVVVHETKVFGASDADPGPRFRLEVRNKLWMLGRGTGLRPAERALYGASTLRRWARTLARSADRPTLLRGLAAGLREGLAAPPPTGRVLADALGYAAAPTPSTAPGAGARPRRTDGFAVLMSCYAGDQPEALATAFRSVTADQTRPPDQVVLVVDGPLPAALAARVDQLVAGSPVPVTLVRQPVNLGLGPALNAGLAACRHEIVARMDADDLSLPHRFAVQVPLIEGGLDLVGSALVEFAHDPDDPADRGIHRDVATEPGRIAAGMRMRQTVNHPTAVFRASAVEAAGGYEDLPSLEDYLLFARMIQAGVRVGNVAEPLLLYRVGAGAYARRGGLRLLRSELALQRRFLRTGFTSPLQAAGNVLVRGGYRIVPEDVRRTAYRAVFGRGRRGPGGRAG